MDTILKRGKTRLASSLRFKIAAAFAVMLLAALGVINLYPEQVVRRQMLESAYEDMLGGAITLANGLAQGTSTLSRMKNGEIESTVAFFEKAQSRRVLVLDKAGVVRFDSVKTTDLKDRVALFPEVFSALDGYDTFSSNYSDTRFETRAASPVVRDGQVEGAVFLYRNNTDNAELLRQVRSDMKGITVVGLVSFFSLSMFFNVYLSTRFQRLLGGIDAMGRGDYGHQIRMGGSDELSGIAERFNELGKKLERTEAVRRQFVSDASHELKTPLASIKLLSDSITQNAHVSEGDMREFVRDIGEEIQRLIRISEHLLSLTRLDSLPPADTGRCDAGKSVRRCAELLRGSAEYYRVRLCLEFEGEHWVRGAEDGVFHIVFNLMENAVKYNRPGGRVWVTLERREGMVVLAVRDNGIGIPQDEMGKVFDRFYRVDKTRSRETGGTGLGLSIVREWAENMGGRVEIESRTGQGTQFRVFLPATEEAGHEVG